MNLINLFITSVLTENIVLTKFLGICSFMGTSNREKSALSMGIVVTIVTMLSSIISYGLYYGVLVPTNTTYLKTIMFVFIIGLLVQIITNILKKYIPSLYKLLGIYLPLVTTNCAVFGITLLNISNEYSFVEMLVYSFGSSVGFTLVIYVFSTIREYLETRNIPKCFKGIPIAFITAAIMSLVFGRLV